jgi:hypothetical protein
VQTCGNGPRARCGASLRNTQPHEAALLHEGNQFESVALRVAVHARTGPLLLQSPRGCAVADSKSLVCAATHLLHVERRSKRRFARPAVPASGGLAVWRRSVRAAAGRPLQQADGLKAAAGLGFFDPRLCACSACPASSAVRPQVTRWRASDSCGKGGMHVSKGPGGSSNILPARTGPPMARDH